MAKTTVLMTVYNAGSYLEGSIKSVLRQSCRGFDFVIVDDCSTDNSARIIDSFRDPRIRVYRNEVNIGQTKSLNKGLSLIQGEYVARMDADDLVFPFWLERQVSFLESNPEYVVVSAPAVIIDGSSRVKRTLRSLWLTEDIRIKSLLGSPINHVGCVMRRDDILRAGGYDETFKVAADYELWSDLLRKGFKITSVKEPLLAIRVHEQSVSIKESQRATSNEVARTIRRNFSEIAKSPISDEEAFLISRLDYGPTGLDGLDFIKIISLLKKGIENIGAQFCLTSAAIKQKIRGVECAIYMKEVFRCIKQDKVKDACSLLKDYMRKHGFLNLFFIVFLCSGGGLFLGKWLVRLYGIFEVARARLKMRDRDIRGLGIV